MGRINDMMRRSSCRSTSYRLAPLEKESLGNRPARGLTSQTHRHVMEISRRSQETSWGVKLGRLRERPCTSSGSGLPTGLHLGRRGSHAIALVGRMVAREDRAHYSLDSLLKRLENLGQLVCHVLHVFDDFVQGLVLLPRLEYSLESVEFLPQQSVIPGRLRWL